jgi:hypothetical protein
MDWRELMINSKITKIKKIDFILITAMALSLLSSNKTQAASLYAGTSYPGMVYSYDGTSWTAISGDLGVTAVLDLIEYQGKLYASTMNPGAVLCYEGGTNWSQIWSPPDGAYQVCDLEVYNDVLYAGTAGTGGKLYRYNISTNTFDYVGIMPYTDSGGYTHSWSGIRAMYSWSQTGDLHLGDIGYDCLGRFDGTNMIFDAYMGGSCIYDFADFNGKLYAGAWAGRLLWSSSGTGRTWSYTSYSGEYIWELEPFQGYLYMGNYGGVLSRLNTSGTREVVWTTPSGSYYQQICAMVTDEDSMLYFGTGGEAGYFGTSDGVAKVYSYNGTGSPLKIFDADGSNSSGVDHAGIQCLYIPPNEPPNCDGAFASPNCIWPPNNKFVKIDILGVTDPDGDPVTITITGITSDEPTATVEGAGGSEHSPDATGIGKSSAQVRAERSGNGNGRVYEISFSATDGKGGMSAGSVIVNVPHDQKGKDCTCIDDGQKYDATEVN